MTTESLMIHAIKRGLLLNDFNELSVGMILDYINRYDVLTSDISEERESSIIANQSHFDTF